MPNINSSSLALRRKRLGYERKQIAFLLGHKTTHQLCHYETGQRTPSFKEAVKLSLLYALPLRALFDRYFRHSFEELENTIKHSGSTVKINLENNQSTADFCSYLELLNSPRITDSDADRIRRHIKILVEERSKKILGN
jgi:transcriptional regulator with XRE-family HTH domain